MPSWIDSRRASWRPKLQTLKILRNPKLDDTLRTDDPFAYPCHSTSEPLLLNRIDVKPLQRRRLLRRYNSVTPTPEQSHVDGHKSSYAQSSISRHRDPSIPLSRWPLQRITSLCHGAASELAGMMGLNGAQEPAAGQLDSTSAVSGDDPLDGNLSPRGYNTFDKERSSASSIQQSDDATSVSTIRTMALPTVRARPEYNTIYRKERDDEQSGSRQNVVCVVSIDMPSRRRVQGIEENEDLWQQKLESIQAPHVSEDGRDDTDDDCHENGAVDRRGGENAANVANQKEQAQHTSSSSDEEEEAFSFGVTPAAGDPNHPFADAIDDLRARIVDWKGHSVERFGNLEIFDFLGVRQDNVVRDFYVYLFKEALLCVTEEKKREKSLARLIGASASQSDDATSATGGSSKTSKAALKLKGRIWLRHIRRCESTDKEGGPSLSIKLDDEGLDHFVLCFKDEGVREMWHQKLDNLLQKQKKVAARKEGNGAEPTTPGGERARSNGKSALSPSAAGSGTENGHEAAMSRPPTASTSAQSMASGKSGSNTSVSSPYNSSRNIHTVTSPKANRSTNRIIPGLPTHQQWSASGGLDPHIAVPDLLSHTPMDLVIMISVPSVATQPAVSSSTLSSSAALKLRLIRSTLDFVISHLGPRDRAALVSYNVGPEGLVRRTALLNSSKGKSREKLEHFVETIGKPWEGPGEDPYREDIDRLAGNGDRTDTVTAVNVGFDIVLQRKSKNPITGMILINDTADAPKRGQMNLVMARAEAANVPVHCFGFGKSHDPSSLWLISNHTHGSYTFVKEWYQLRECVVGCIGSMMSVALTDVKLHMSVPSDNHFRVRKVAGPSGAIVSASGKDVDIELGELRYGERKELFVELELDLSSLLLQHSINNRRKPAQDHYEKGSATDDFMQRLGLQGLSITESSSTDKMKSDAHDTANDIDIVEEVAVFEVQCGCRDPSIGVVTNRLPDPCVMTIEIDSSSQDPTSAAGGPTGLATALADPVVTRRRLEILVSDMITRSLLLVSRRNHHQALTILIETRKIVDTVLQAIPLRQADGSEGTIVGRSNSRYGKPKTAVQAILATSQPRGSHAKRQRELLHRKTALSLLAILDDLDVLIDGLESSKGSSFERTERNFGAQQAMVLRDQKAWTSRTDTEWQVFHTIDNGPPFAALAASFAAYVGR